MNLLELAELLEKHGGKLGESAQVCREAQAETEKLKRELTRAQQNNHARNLQLDALHFVWCDGGCKFGVHRFDEKSLTLETVQAAMRNTARLVRYFKNYHYRRLSAGEITQAEYERITETLRANDGNK